MIEKEIYSSKSFLKILEKNKINCKFQKCILFPEYVVYSFKLAGNQKLTEFQIYSVALSVIVESEHSCYFIGKNGDELLFLLTLTNDLKKFGLKKTKKTSGIVPTENYEFDFMKKPLEKLVWYKFDTKKLADNIPLKDFLEDANEEQKPELEEIWNEIIS